MESLTPITKSNSSKYTAILPNVQTPAIAEIWGTAAEVAASGLGRGFSRRAVAAKAAEAAHNHPRRRELPGDPAERFLIAHQAGFDAVQYVMARGCRA